MDLEQIFEIIRGEGGVIFLLLAAVVVFFRGGIVTGRAYEATVAAYEKRLADREVEVKFWRESALRAVQAGERAINGGTS